MTSPEPPRHIFEAVSNNDLPAVVEFVEKRYISLKNHDLLNQTVAHLAADKGYIPIVKYLLDKDPYLLTARDGNNFTIFHRAVQRGGLPVVKYLMDEYKMDPYTTVEEEHRNTALHVAAQWGQLDVVKYFVEEKGMDVNLKNAYQQPPAFSAALNRKVEVIKYFIEWQKADVTEVDIKNDNILFYCARRNDLTLIKYLLDDRRLKIDINWRGYWGKTLVYWGARFRKVELLSYLVEEKNADVNIADNNGWTPLHFAAHIGNIKAVKYLVKHKANYRAKNKDGNKPTDVCKHFIAKNYLEGILNLRSRHARSVMPASSELFISDFEHTPPDISELRDKFIGSGRWSVDSVNTGTGINLKRADDVNDIRFNTLFLVIGNAVVRLCGGYRKKKHHNLSTRLLSPHQIVESRIDQNAVVAANADIDFRN